ncbi:MULTISPECIES: L-2-hydroxyglutarate oxidase [Nocardiopsis]|uniref:FAD dependent oxidoreductase n=2 Tax=Nocardiopsis TaxID=2013 RepID=D7B1N0_NOCDD|nr:L-2-hydroxyglutarate oxidase [Nocardiopsis dassonvillei]ADH68456.1 FAD dependent oxidoreductase [Nocardiopsis dassonvillei subsp. dassonvillei DSM 43111]APC36550.1 hydroxyglutarate oxidase [Nocardiopsis dassonvillei]NKY80697.1 L-2-hydroxyglutarate oxidase [Nocardiopsis dassonvillei]VEI88962.1 L-2-hydroxyglutarate oxidase LhgO [Nocardiopsis dassonvillei]
MRSTEHIGVIGAGIVGLALARRLTLHRPGTRVTVLEKEDRVAAHQTGRNSGVVHAGLYYRPGSLKATLCRRGVGLLRDYCAEHGLPYHEVGKVLVAADAEDEARLDDVERRARENGVPGVTRLGPGGLREIEPHAAGVAALHSPTTAVTDFVAVAEQFADDVRRSGGRILLNTPVLDLRQEHDGVRVLTGDPRGERLVHRFDRLVVCGGLHSDRLARMAGAPEDPRVVPFRGQYHELVPERRHLVNGLLYPVPDPRYPFLGVHLTRHVHGEVMAGPNAVLATALEGYRARDVRTSELARTLSWPGFWRLARRHWTVGAREALVSASRAAFAAQARRLLPELAAADLRPAPSGVRAQALARDGSLLDDFHVDTHGRVVCVRNAPSPAATSSLAIAEFLTDTFVP